MRLFLAIITIVGLILVFFSCTGSMVPNTVLVTPVPDQLPVPEPPRESPRDIYPDQVPQDLSPGPGQPNGSISGHVSAAANLKPIAGALIEVCTDWSCATVIRTEKTTMDGSYVVTNLAPGRYGVRASAEGFLTVQYKNGLILYCPQNFYEVTVLDKETTQVDVKLEIPSSISGHVYDSRDKKPVAGARVLVYDPSCPPFYHETISAADGSYIVKGLYSGEWFKVAAVSPGYVTKWYDNVYRYQSAAYVATRSGQETPNIDIGLEWGGSIYGRVYKADRITPASGVEVICRPKIRSEPNTHSRIGRCGPAFTSEEYDSVVTNGDGSYIITGLFTGEYELAAEIKGQNQYILETVSITTGKETSADLTASSCSISGHVYQSDGKTPMSGVKIEVGSTRIEGTAYWSKSGSTVTDSDGKYVITDLPPGKYKAYAKTVGYQPETYDGVADVYSLDFTRISVTSGETTGIDFKMTLPCSISGRVYDASNNKAIVNAMVCGCGRFDPCARTAADGSYKIRNLHRGEYTLFILADGYVPQYYNGVNDRANATKVITMSGENTYVDIGLEKGGSISGHVYQSDGITPATNVRVGWLQVSGTKTPDTRFEGLGPPFVEIDADGSYTIGGLLSGDYQLWTPYAGWPDAMTKLRTVSVIQGQPTNGIDLILSR